MMSFSCSRKKEGGRVLLYKKQKKNRKKSESNSQSLQISICSEPPLKKEGKKKMSLFTFQTGSLTVETALILPCFLLAVFTILYIVEIFRVQDSIQFGLQQTAKELAKYTYVRVELESGEKGGLEKLEVPVNLLLSETYVRERVLEYAGKGVRNNSIIKNGAAGISFLQTKIWNQNGILDLVADYRISLPFSIFFVRDYFVTQRARVHAWTGYEPLEEGKSEEQMVYITVNGTVYHISRNCTYLQLSVRQVESAGLENLRNEQGGKYYSCERCVNGNTDRYVYITDSGNRYHNQLSCSSLKRSILVIPISEAGGRAMCTRCRE